MLEPDPSSRSTIEDVSTHEWLQLVEVCHEVQDPTHVHTNARAMSAAFSTTVKDGSGVCEGSEEG